MVGIMSNMWNDEYEYHDKYTIPMPIDALEKLRTEIQKLQKFKAAVEKTQKTVTVNGKKVKVSTTASEDKLKIVELQEKIKDLRFEVKSQVIMHQESIKLYNELKKKTDPLKERLDKITVERDKLKKEFTALKDMVAKGVLIQFKPTTLMENGDRSDVHRFNNMDYLSHEEEQEVLSKLPKRPDAKPDNDKKKEAKKKSADKKKCKAKETSGSRGNISVMGYYESLPRSLLTRRRSDRI